MKISMPMRDPLRVGDSGSLAHRKLLLFGSSPHVRFWWQEKERNDFDRITSI
jgi:hypothetical protein